MRNRFLLLAGIAAALLIAIVSTAAYPVAANQASATIPTIVPLTPRPTPIGNGGNAIWTIKSDSFKSFYPDGFYFQLEVSSSVGKIAHASIFWRHGQAGAFRYQAEIDPSGKVSYRWHPRRGDGVPQWVGVEYWWVLTDSAGNNYETPRVYDEYADNTRKWSRVESEDIIVFWEAKLPSTIGQQVITAMKKQRPFYLKNWGQLLSYRPRIIVYADPKAWLEWNPFFDYEHVQGQTSPDWGGTVQVYNRSVRELAYGVALHEIGHLYQFANGGLYQRHIWFFEGDATFFEIAQDYDYLDRVRQWAAEGDLPTLQDGGPNRDNRDAYDLGYAFWKWFTDAYGSDSHRKVWTAVKDGKSVLEAFESVGGKPFLALETDFRSWLGMRNPAPPTLMVLPTLSFPPTPDRSKKATPKP